MPDSFRELARSASKPMLEPLGRVGQTLRSYNLDKARGDLMAGGTVAVVAIPQTMAYAIIAGLEDQPQYGLYTVIFQCAIAALFNSHPLLSVGPINTQSVLVASILTRIYTPGDGPTYLSLVVALTFIKGLIQIALAAGRMGALVRYVSRSVIVGFTAGAGALIAAKQLRFFLGIDAPQPADAWPGVVGVYQRIAPALDGISLHALGLGVLTLVIVVSLRAVSRLIPGPLIAVAVTGGIVAAMGWTGEQLALVPEFERTLPTPSLPVFPLELLEPLIIGGLALSLLGLMEAYSIAKTLGAKTGDRVSANQELFSQGLTNFLTSFVSAIPGSGSFSRSALNHFAGGKTMISSIYASLMVLGIFLLLAPAAKFVPMTAIAAILFVVAFGLIDWRYFLTVIRASRSDAAVCGITFVSTLFLPLEYAVFVGVILNIAAYLRRASQLHLAQLVQERGGPLLERPLRDRSGREKAMFLQIEGNLFFANADELDDQLASLTQSQVQVVILRLKRTHNVDATVMTVLERFVDRMHDKGGHVLLCGVKQELHDRLQAYGLVDRIGEENVFLSQTGIFTSAKQAVRRGREIVGSSIDEEDLFEEPNPPQPVTGA